MMVSAEITINIPHQASAFTCSLNEKNTLIAVKGIILTIIKELIPADAYLNPITIPIWPHNPMLLMSASPANDGIDKVGIDVRFGITRIAADNM